MPEEIIKEYVKCQLTETEMKKEAEKMAYCLSKRAELEGDLKSVKKQIESEIAKVDAELISAVTKYQSGFEMRNVECRIDKDFQTNTIRIIRMDTGELIRERAMSSEERQQELFDKGKEPEAPQPEAPPVEEEKKETTGTEGENPIPQKKGD